MNTNVEIKYIANMRLPTEKAHGLVVMKFCEALVKKGVRVSLLVPRRKNHITGSPFSFYGVEESFTITKLPVVDLFFIEKYIGVFAFWLEYTTFYLFAILRLIFSPRGTIVYTRDIGALFFRFFFFTVIYECHSLPKNKPFFFFLNKLANKVIVISHELKKEYLENGFMDKDILVSPSGVDLSIFSINLSSEEARKELNLPLDKKIVGYTGNFRTFGLDKGIEDILQSLTKLPGNIYFIAVGGTTDEITFYEKIASKLGVESRTIFYDRVPQERLAQYQKACDILLMPFPDMPHYRFHMSPVKMFEYMASKVPIIASDLPTIREVLNENNSNFVKAGDINALAQKIIFLLENTRVGEKLALKALEDVQKYSWDTKAEKVLYFIQT